MSTSSLEREIKLQFASAAEARDAILRTRATLLRGRRLQEDCLLDTADERLRNRRSVLRVRTEQGRSLLTYKGPVQPSPFKLREERETVVADGETMRYILEQFGALDAIIALDETPIGTFVEIEGSEQAIETITVDLGRTPADYLVDSYRGLYVRHCAAAGRPVGDMVFEE